MLPLPHPPSLERLGNINRLHAPPTHRRRPPAVPSFPPKISIQNFQPTNQRTPSSLPPQTNLPTAKNFKSFPPNLLPLFESTPHPPMKSLLLPLPSSHLSKSLPFLPHRSSAPLFVSRLRFLARPFASPPPSSPSSSSCRLPRSLCFCRPISMSSTAASGEIHVIVGPMFAGKTTALLRRLQAECDSGRNVAVVKSNKDTRYGIDSIVTHDGLKMPCLALPDLSSFAMKVGIEEYQKLDVIGIDEGQFFGDLYDFCCKVADYDGKTVIVAGLDGDFLRRSFGSIIDIIPLADTVTKLSARCELCGNRAHFTLRKTSDTQAELIGGSDVYMPVCRQHYVNGQVVMEAARSVLESHKIHCESAHEVSPVTV